MTFAHALLWASLAVLTSAVVFDQKIDIGLLGPIYQPAANDSFKAWADAKMQATNAIHRVIQTGSNTYGPFDNQGTSFSASVFDLDSDEPLFDFHFEAPTLKGSYTKGKLSDNTIYRTGSLGKLLVMYAWMIDIGDSVFGDPITKYIPELAAAPYKDSLSSTNWSEVTVGSLASQISGIGRDVSLGDIALAEFQSPPVSDDIPNGFPPLNNETIIECQSYGPLPACTRAQFLSNVINHPPVFPSYTSPSYSNMAFVLLGFAYQNITGRTIDQGQLDWIHKLGMTSTTPRPPSNISSIDAIIPRNDSYAVFSYDLNVQSPAGGQYTSTKDLKTWGQAILSNKLLSPEVTRRWCKPTTFTAQWEAAVGAPWEIYRLPIPVNSIINTSRLVDTYSKSGDVGQYSTYLGLAPDYNIGISVMAAGDNSNRQVPPVRGVLVDIFYKAAEAAAKEQASRAFTGHFKSADRNSSITLAVDGGPGVVIQQWISNGTNFLQNEFYAASDDFRLYPTTLSTQGSDGLTYYKYHVDILSNHGEPQGGDPWDELNDYWIQLDGLMYNNLSPDAFVVGFDKDGIVQSVASQALRTTMVRTAA